MSSDPDFRDIMAANGFEVTDETEQDEVIIDYTGLSITYATDQGYPITVRVEFPVGQAMDAARALVVSGGSVGIRSVLAGAASLDDASVHGYFDANGIVAAEYIEATFAELGEEPPPLSDADDFFRLD